MTRRAAIAVTTLVLALPCRERGLLAQIADGSFESGDYSGWTVQEAPGGQANVNCGVWGIVQDGQTVAPNDQLFDFADFNGVTVSTPGLPATFAATEGRFLAVQLQRCALTTRRMSQVVSLAPGAATLRWDMRYTNQSGTFVEGAQDIEVTVRNPATGSVLPGGTIFRTTEGVDPPSIGSMTAFSADLSAFAGQTVRLAFDLNAALSVSPFKGIDVAIDSVRVYDAGGVEVPGDYDADGVRDGADNCRTVPNPTQADFDGDSVGDACDDCRKEPNPNQDDADRDGVGDACESTDFVDGDIYFLAGGYPLGHYLHDPKAARAIVRMDPFSGRRTVFHVFETGVGALEQMTYDPFRKCLVLKPSASATQFFKFDSRGVRSTFPTDWPHSVFLWTPTGDGRIYMIGLGEAAGRPFGYLDEGGHGHDLLGLDGQIQRLNLSLPFSSGFIYDLGTDSLFLALSDGSTGTRVYKLPLSPDGSRLRAPIQSADYDAFPGTTSEVPGGMSAGPRGSMLLKIDVNANTTGVMMFTVDPATLAFQDFATFTGITGASTVGTYNSATGRGIDATGVINTFWNTIRLRAFTQSAAPQVGELISEYLSGLVPTGVSRMISIGDTINRSYRLTLELDDLSPGGDVYGIAGERIRLHGTAFLRASHRGATGWSIGIRGDGASAAFGFDPCDEACASSLTFFHGTDEVASNDPTVVDSGIVDRVSLRPGVELGSRRVKLLRFWVEVTVPHSLDGEEVRLSFDDDL